jgi:antirestriction protein
LAELKAQYAQEISAASMQIADYQKTVEETMRRAAEAEAYQKTVQAELAEAKVVQKYNAQLHKDLQREQLARKKLHNDMEDLKGKCYFNR